MSLTFLEKFKHLTDEEIVKEILTEDCSERRVLQEIIYDRYSNRIYRKCLIILKDKQLAKDISHDVFISIFTKLSTFRNESSFGGWISKIAYNQCLKYFRDKKNFQNETIDENYNAIEDKSSEALSEKLLKEASIVNLENAIADLNDVNRTIILMKYMDNLSIAEIAKEFEMGESAIKMRLKRSREQLAENIKNSVG